MNASKSQTPTTTRRLARALGPLGLLLGLLAGPPVASAHTLAIKGTWQQLINCAPTSFDAQSKQLTCIGKSLWSGTWSGTTAYTFQGTYDLVTGNSKGTIHEVFTGKASDGTSGTLTFIEHSTINGANNRMHIDAAIVAATGGFTGSTAHVTFDGTDNALTGSGTYTGVWYRPGSDDAGRAVTTRRHKKRHRARHSDPRHRPAPHR